ncbi:GspH/FimT family pseudopilin [Vibrio furnissii]|uniref:GspH/FimT family pseudopilin n=1 Tax=Vibrio furnissii TaxID=29494 RepID=UPI001559DDBC|nr:GspH/FimT family pseudopilin [Vibrio furnissii]
MVRGFTLLELLITVAVLSAMLVFAAPNFQRFSQQHQMQTLASELQGFLQQAKSEAVFRNQDLWAHIVMDSNPSSTGLWQIILNDSDSVSAGSALLVMSGQPFRHIKVTSNFSSDQVKFDGVRGKIKGDSIFFSPVADANQQLKLSTSFGASRIIVCGEQGAVYGYPKCN